MARSITKIDPSLLTPLARMIAAGVIPRLPSWVTPNQITWLGFYSNIVSAAAFLLTAQSRNWFLLVCLMLVLNWVADNLDGELARARQQTSERGFFLDIVLDQIGVMIVSLGLAYSAYIYDFSIAMLSILAYQLMSFVTLMHIIMRQRFPLGRLSPAEGRLGLIVLSLLTMAWPVPLLTIAGHTLGWFEAGVLLTLPFAIGERLIDGIKLYFELSPPQSRNE
jgi:archaetidylinositol phosphate synthase